MPTGSSLLLSDAAIAGQSAAASTGHEQQPAADARAKAPGQDL
jgi:hypothetical protein